MNKLIVSMTRFSTAMALFAVDQVEKTVKVVGGGGEALSKTVDGIEGTLNSLTDILAGKMDEKKRNTLQSVAKMTEDTVQRTIDSVDVIVPREAFHGTTELMEKTRDATAGWLSKAATSVEDATEGLQPTPKMLSLVSHLLPPLTQGISLFIPGRDSETAWRNAKNNAEIIQLVVNVSSILPPHGVYVPLPELVEKCYAMGTFPALWAVEGLGHYYGDTFYERNEVPQHLLTDPKLRSLPSKSLTMLHAGIGLSFAQQNLLKLTSKSPASEFRTTVEKFVALCKNSSREGYTGAAVESLGLVARNFHGLPVLKACDEALSAIDPDLVGYLWRGAGRAVYFSVPNFIPGYRSPWRAVEMCRQEPPHDVGRHNMLAGFAWAVTVVNMRHPMIMETLLKYHGEEFAEQDAFTNGVISSMIMRYDTTPDDPNIDRFCKYRPVSSDPKITDFWDRLVGGPCDRALREIYPVLKERKHLEAIFQYQDLAALVKNLKKPHATKSA
jgi:hypothetical protein